MHFNILQSDSIYDGDADVDFVDAGDTWTVNYRAHARIGYMQRLPFGRHEFIGTTQDKSGSVSVPKQFLTEAFLKANSTFQVGSASFTKISDDTFSVSVAGAGGQIKVRYHGADPVELGDAEATGSYLGINMHGILQRA